MAFFYCVILVLGYAPTAAWAVRWGGGRRLWGLAAITLGLILLGGILLGYRYAVPNTPRLLLYLLAFSAPAVLLPTLLLWAQRARPRARAAAVPITLVGGVIGLGVGWVLVLVASLPVGAGAATLEVVPAASEARYRDEVRWDTYLGERTLTTARLPTAEFALTRPRVMRVLSIEDHIRLEVDLSLREAS